MLNLITIVRQWLVRNNHNISRLNEEMNRRHTDSTQSIKTYYVEPIFREVVETVRRTEEEADPTFDWPQLGAFKNAEAIRDYLEIEKDYP